MKNIFLLLAAITFVACNNVIQQEGESDSQDSIVQDTSTNESKLNDIINQNRESGDSIKNVENLEPQLKNNPE